MKFFVLIFLFLTTSIVFSQKRELNLSDAVLQQYRSLSPEKLYGFNWIPNTAQYTFFDNKFSTLSISKVGDYVPQKLIDIKEMSEVLKTDIRFLGGLTS